MTYFVVDIDECARGIHECEAHEECINEEGSYFCDDPNFEPETDISDPVDVKCPPGYKFNYDKLVCDGKLIKLIIPVKAKFFRH